MFSNTLKVALRQAMEKDKARDKLGTSHLLPDGRESQAAQPVTYQTAKNLLNVQTLSIDSHAWCLALLAQLDNLHLNLVASSSKQRGFAQMCNGYKQLLQACVELCLERPA
jgi:hypothetical protein